MRNIVTRLASIAVLWASWLPAEEISSVPKIEPATRPELKAALEALKQRTPRLPLPPPVEGEASVNNGRMRALYLPESWGGKPLGSLPAGQVGTGNARGQGNSSQAGRRRRGADPDAKLDYALSTSCFWVVSRGNNCHYCLGHQELKLRAVGLADNTIAALDCDWSQFDPKTQAALALARKLTLEPQHLGDGDITVLKALFSDEEIIELVFSIARFNATNRWTDGLGIPQDSQFHEGASQLTTPTEEKYQRTTSLVSPKTRAPRLAPPTWDEVEQNLAQAAHRTPRVTLPSEAAALASFGTAIGERKPWDWERAASVLSPALRQTIAGWSTMLSDEHLPVRLKAELALISAARNHAWYAVGHAVHRLRDLGGTTEEMTFLCNFGSADPAAKAAHRFAAKLTEHPHLISDADVAELRREYSDAETAQIVQLICIANLFDRFSEALGLTLEVAVD